jgi:hypothetical protein
VFRIELLPAAQGDSIWVEYGTGRSIHRVLIDGGTAPTYDHLRARALALPEGRRRFELLIVTHVDSDHIQGIIRLLQDRALSLEFADVWFNGWKHLPTDRLGPAEGEMLSALLTRRAPGQPHGLPWNRAFEGGPVQVPTDAGAGLPQVRLEGGMDLTLLSPTQAELAALAPVWAKEVQAAELEPGDSKKALELLGRRRNLRPDALGPGIDVEEEAGATFESDGTRPNGSSIVVLAEHAGVRCLFAGDAQAPVLEKTIPRLIRDRGSMEMDAFKLPHHGSRKNVSLPLVRSLPSRRYLFSTNGAIYHHPDVPAVSRVLVGSDGEKELIFNYRTVHNEMWLDGRLLEDYRATSRYPDPSGAGVGITIDL